MNLALRLHSSLFLALVWLSTSLSAGSMLVPKTISTGPQSEFVVFWLVANEEASDRDFVAPASLAGVLHSGTTLSRSVVLKAQGACGPVPLARGTFARLEYRFEIPIGITGPVVLDVPETGATPLMFSVQPLEQAQAANQGAGVQGPEKIQRDTALRRSTRLLPGVSAHEPVYFGFGMHGGASAKFQVSLKYNPFDQWPFYLGYTQTSVWDLHSTSKPFRDASYRPAFFLQDHKILVSPNGKFSLGGLSGFEHESNGRAGNESRSINIAFVRPRLEWRLAPETRLVLSPKIYAYIEKSENPDIGDYRGFVDFYAGFIHHDFRLSTTLRKGARHSYGSIQVDAVFPLRSTDSLLARLGLHGMSGYWFLQYFNGWGESILDYNHKLPSQFRTGMMVVP